MGNFNFCLVNFTSMSQAISLTPGFSSKDAVEMGSVPAPGAADRALAVGICRRTTPPVGICVARRVRREGAPNGSRGGCAPQNPTAWFWIMPGCVRLDAINIL
jgi:hypothetical protein